jgi:hypothetical protein
VQTGGSAERKDEKRRATTGRKSRREGTNECEASSAVMEDEGKVRVRGKVKATVTAEGE